MADRADRVETPAAAGRHRAFCALVAILSLAIFARSLPLVAAYAARFSAAHPPRALILVAAAGAVALGVLSLALLRFPRSVAWIGGAAALLLLITSGSIGAAAAAAFLLAATLLVGDAVFRALVGVEAEGDDLASLFAAGTAALGTALLLLGEIDWLRPVPLVGLTAVLALARRRRIAAAARALSRVRPAPAGPLRPHEAVWLAIVILVLFSSFVTTLAPEVTYDALAYHLPAARDAAARGAVEPLPDVLPQTLFWRGHQTFLALGFFFEGERVARLLQFALGVAVFGAASALRRRIAGRAGRLLVPLALVSMPLAVLQIHSVWADWPAALLVTASAAEICAPAPRAGRLRLAGFLFGGAVAVKIFALLAAPALLILWWTRRGARPIRGALGAAACALLVVAPWAAWSESRGGGVLPYVPSVSVLVHRWMGAPQPRAASVFESPERQRRARDGSLARFLRLPYDLTFHGTRWEGIPDGYNGMLPLLLLAGTLGWGSRRFLLFVLAALAAVVPWNLLYAPSTRYLFPVLPLYFVFAAAGLDRLIGGFPKRLGMVAGLGLAALTLAFPGQFFSLPFDAGVALGRTTREAALAAYLPSYPFWRLIGPRDHVLFAGEWDRFHCPAERAWRTGWFPIGSWGDDPARWRRGARELSIRYCVFRSDNSTPIPLPANDLEIVARRGPATLYRVRIPTDSAAGLPRND